MIRIAGFPDYSVTSDGRVFSHKRGRTTELKQKRTTEGYGVVSLCLDGDVFTRHVHALVAEAYLGPRPAGQVVRHLDGNGSNSAASNLAYGTYVENEGDKVLHGTRLQGEDVAGAKLTDAQVLELRAAYANGVPQPRLCEQYDVHPATLHRAIHGEAWAHLPVPDYGGRIPERAKGEWNRGSGHGMAKLDEQAVAAIRARLAVREKQRSIAADFGVTRATIGRIARGEGWRHAAVPGAQ